jgi:hypothetical protein
MGRFLPNVFAIKSIQYYSPQSSTALATKMLKHGVLIYPNDGLWPVL